MDDDAREALRVLQAIRVLQRWLLDRPLGADSLHLTATTLTLSDGQDTVATIALPST
jgi:hypothetical protein